MGAARMNAYRGAGPGLHRSGLPGMSSIAEEEIASLMQREGHYPPRSNGEVARFVQGNGQRPLNRVSILEVGGGVMGHRLLSLLGDVDPGCEDVVLR